MKKQFDFPIFFTLVGLAFFSLFTIFGIEQSLFFIQTVYFLIGFLFLFIFYKLGINFFRLNSRWFYAGGVILLLVSFFFGEEIRGSRRWLDLYFFKFQASEFLKVFFIIYLSDFFARDQTLMRFSLADWRKILVSFLVFVPPILIIFKQPDLGSSLVYVLIYLSVLFFAGFSIKYFIYLLFFIILVTPLTWRFLEGYQKNRILSFFNPSIDPAGISYNLIQSIITIGSGGFLGRGLGRGTQSRFLFLPENTTDFAFASSVEQFGLIGGASMIAFYGVIVVRLMKKIRRFSQTDYSFLFLVSVLVFLSAHLFINVGMNLGLVPIAGIPLPLISYGGSSVVSTLMLFGLVLSL